VLVTTHGTLGYPATQWRLSARRLDSAAEPSGD